MVPTPIKRQAFDCSVGGCASGRKPGPFSSAQASKADDPPHPALAAAPAMFIAARRSSLSKSFEPDMRWTR